MVSVPEFRSYFFIWMLISEIFKGIGDRIRKDLDSQFDAHFLEICWVNVAVGKTKAYSEATRLSLVFFEKKNDQIVRKDLSTRLHHIMRKNVIANTLVCVRRVKHKKDLVIWDRWVQNVIGNSRFVGFYSQQTP